MVDAVIAIGSLLLFCLCCRGMMVSLSRKVPILNNTQYSKKALRIERGYRVFAFGVLTLFFLAGTVISFSSAFLQL